METLLNSHRHFMLGPWIVQAYSKAHTAEEKLAFRNNMLNQLTLWGPRGEILDYARKQWAGLLEHYYLPRWRLFLKRLIHGVKKGEKFSQRRFNKEVFETIERPFTFTKIAFNVKPVGDSIQIVKKMRRKYNDQCQHVL